MNFTDAELAEGLHAHGLPPHAATKRVDEAGPTAEILLRWPPQAAIPDAQLVLECDPRRRPFVEVTLAARAFAGTAVPGAAPLRIEGLPHPAVLQPGPLGQPARDGVAFVDVLILLGTLTSATWGDQPQDGTFVPTATSWQAAVERRLNGALAAACATGVELGGLATALHRHALDRRSSWAEATFGLVHGDLVPANVRVDEQGTCIVLLGWGDALLGDPLIDWAPAIESPTGVLESGLVGRTPPWSEDPSAIARLESYVALRALERLVECGRPWLDGGGARLRAAQIEAARVLAHEALAPDRVTSRLRPGFQPPIRPRADAKPTQLLRRRVLEALRHPVGPAHVLPLLSALASTTLETDAVVERASPALRALPPMGHPWACAPISDRVAWRAQLIEACTAKTGGLVLGLVALALHAVDAVHGEVDDGTLRGIERLAALRTPPAGWRDAAVGTAAATHLGLDPTVFGAALAEVPDDAEADADELVDGLAFIEWWTTPHAAWTPILAWAVGSLPDGLRERVVGQVLD